MATRASTMPADDPESEPRAPALGLSRSDVTRLAPDALNGRSQKYRPANGAAIPLSLCQQCRYYFPKDDLVFGRFDHVMANTSSTNPLGSNEYLAKLMRLAVDVAKLGIEHGQSPFGAVIADAEGQIVATEHNQVRQTNDSTAHAEIVAIRAACRNLGTPNLSGYVIATTCEPCPMCAAAIHWARLDKVIYGASIADAKQAHFNELSVSAETLYGHGQSLVQLIPCVLPDECRALFELWKTGPNPLPY